MTTKTEPLFELADIVAAFDQPGIDFTEDAYAYLLEVANRSVGPGAGLFRCTSLAIAAEKLVRTYERLTPDAVAVITRQDLVAAARARERDGGGGLP